MQLHRFITLLAFAVIMVAASARADQKADRASIADALGKLSASAAELAKTARASDDRGARKKFGPAAAELGDGLAALARRVAKDVAVKSLVTDAAAVDKDAAALVDLADEADDKGERKSLRAQATLIHQGIANTRKELDALKDGDAAVGAQRYTGRLLNNSDSCSWAENLKFVISRDDQQVFSTLNMVFPGKEVSLALDKGRYVVVLHNTSGKVLGQGNVDATKEGWIFKSGCVNQD